VSLFFSAQRFNGWGTAVLVLDCPSPWTSAVPTERFYLASLNRSHLADSNRIGCGFRHDCCCLSVSSATGTSNSTGTTAVTTPGSTRLNLQQPIAWLPLKPTRRRSSGAWRRFGASEAKSALFARNAQNLPISPCWWWSATRAVSSWYRPTSAEVGTP
jgi:hypothetical protein